MKALQKKAYALRVKSVRASVPFLFVLGVPAPCRGETSGSSRELVQTVAFPPEWLVPQLVPSPGVAVFASGAGVLLRWQVTPILYAYRMPSLAPKLRVLVVDPLARVSGSLEAVVSPTYVHAGSSGLFALGVGVRTTVPLLDKGEALSAWFGTQYLFFERGGSSLFEAGVTTLFGIVGVDVGFAPTLSGGTWLSGLRLRYF